MRLVCRNYKQPCSLLGMASLAERLKEARTLRGLSQGELAAKVKVAHAHAKMSQQNIAQLEAGTAESTGYLAELADVLEVNTDWLAFGREPRDRVKGIVVYDPTIASIVQVMQTMAPYALDQAKKIVDTLAEQPRKAS